MVPKGTVCRTNVFDCAGFRAWAVWEPVCYAPTHKREASNRTLARAFGAMAAALRSLFVLLLTASSALVAVAYTNSLSAFAPQLRSSGQFVPLGGRPLHSPQARKRNQPCALYMRRKSKSDIPAQKAGNIFKEIHNIDAGCLLVASADEVDHFFRRGVALVIDHGPQGSRGLLLEMATAFKIGEMAPSLKGTPLAENPLFRGGDSGEDKVLMIHSHPSLEGAVPIGQTGVCVGGVAAAVQKVEAGELEADDFKFVFNQVEWTPGQLERELSQGLWRAGIAVPELCTRQVASLRSSSSAFFAPCLALTRCYQVGSQSERDQLFGGSILPIVLYTRSAMSGAYI
eukprot:3941580-Rhodomonas_salina.2